MAKIANTACSCGCGAKELLFIAGRKEATLDDTVGFLQHTLMTVSTTQAFLYLPTDLEVYIPTKICKNIYL